VVCPFLSLAHSGVASTEIFELRTETSITYAMFANGSRSFAFKGSTSDESFTENSVKRNPGTSWNYFAFNYIRLSTQTLVTYGVNSQTSLFFSSNTYRLGSVAIKVGSIDNSKNCLIKLRIIKLEIIYDIINIIFGSDYGPMAYASKMYHPFVALYKLNMSPFARNFVNLLDFESGKLIATIISPQKSKTAVHFPRTGDQVHRYTFGISQIQVFYDPNVTQKSPPISSYTFVMNYRAFGTNYLAKHCRTINACIVPDYKFVFYSRSNLVSPARSFVKAMRSWSFKELFQELRYTLDELNHQIYKEEIVLPASFVDFDLSAGVNFVSVAVDDFFLKATPFIQICFYIPNQMCSSNMAMLAELKEDDIHLTSSSSQPNSYYIYIFVGEISFHGGVNLYYETTTYSLWDSYLKDYLVFYINALDLERVLKNSFYSLTFSSTRNVEIYNCSTLWGCDFCRFGVCLSCKIGYEMINDYCLYSSKECDYLTRTCKQFLSSHENILENLNFRISDSLYYSDLFIIWINIFFQTKKDLGVKDVKAPNNIREYTFFFNSVESHIYNSLIGKGRAVINEVGQQES
jgi:hypothetical protein